MPDAEIPVTEAMRVVFAMIRAGATPRPISAAAVYSTNGISIFVFARYPA
jgi:hypothetical protein